MPRSLFALQPGLTFLNHGSFGACPRLVLEAQSSLRDVLEANPIAFLLERYEPMLDESRRTLARLVGADPEGVAFVTNATTGVNTVLRSLDLGPGDELLCIDQAYGACLNALRATAERTGATLVVASPPFPLTDPQQVVDAIIDRVNERTAFALIDHVTSVTGLVLPIDEIVRRLEGSGVRVMVDGAHAPGMVPLDVEAIGASYYTGNCHKWLCAPKGAGFLWVREDLRDTVRPLVTSHGATARRPGRSCYHDAFDWCGTFDPTPWLCVQRSIEFMQESFGSWESIMAANRALALEARDVLVEALHIEPPAPDSMIGSMAAVPLPSARTERSNNRYIPDPLQVKLRRDYRVEVPINPWPEWPQRVLRVSAQRYNSIADVHRLVDALRSEVA